MPALHLVLLYINLSWASGLPQGFSEPCMWHIKNLWRWLDNRKIPSVVQRRVTGNCDYVCTIRCSLKNLFWVSSFFVILFCQEEEDRARRIVRSWSLELLLWLPFSLPPLKSPLRGLILWLSFHMRRLNNVFFTIKFLMIRKLRHQYRWSYFEHGPPVARILGQNHEACNFENPNSGAPSRAKRAWNRAPYS